MKAKITITLAAISLAVSAPAQDIATRDVPQVVRTSFQNHFPNAKDVEWERSGNHYSADFETGFIWTKDHEVDMDSDGKILRHKEDDLSRGDLPVAVRNAAAANYPNHAIDDRRSE